MTSELANPSTTSSSGLPVPASAPDHLTRLHLSVAGVGDRTVLLDPRGRIRQLVIGLGGGLSEGLQVARTGKVLSPGSIVGYADLRSGDQVEFVAARGPVSHAHVMCFLTGALAGERFVLPAGETRIGRAADNDVIVTEPAMSRHHAVLTVDGDTVTLADAGSTNGVMIGDRMITGPTTLRLGEPALIGQSWFEVELADRAVETKVDKPHHAVIGSSNRVELAVMPRPADPYVGDYIEFPEPPDRPRRHRLRSGRDDFETATAAFERELQAIRDRLAESREAEVAGRLAEAPSVSAVIESITEDLANCWGSSVADGVVARVGLATRPTRTHMLVPGGGDPELRGRLTKLAHDYELIEGVPASVRFDQSPSVVLTGGGAEATALAQSLLAQLAGRYRPSEMPIRAMIDPSRVASWDWLKWLPHCGGSTEDLAVRLVTTEDGFQRLIDDLASLADPARFHMLLVDAELPDRVIERLEEVDLPMSMLIVAGDDRSDGQRNLRFGSEALIVDINGPSASMTEPTIIGIGYETVGPEQLEQLARSLSPVVETDNVGLPPVPGGCTYSVDGTMGHVLRRSDPAIVAELWDIFDEPRLSTVIGHDEAGPVELALDVGPHAIVAGRYECFLPAWLAMLSARHSPHQFNFLLFDSLGGLVFRECRSLPHCVGAVEDMRPVSIKSALAALSAELDRRAAVLAGVGVGSVEELGQHEYVLPRLVVIVDQLCGLGDSSGVNPVGELVELAYRGRRFGLHLVVGLGTELIHESDVLGTAPDEIRDLADLDAVIIHLPRPEVGRLRRVGSEPVRFTANVAGRRPEIVVHRFELGVVERLYRGPIRIAYEDDLARLITLVSKAYDYSGGVRPTWLM